MTSIEVIEGKGMKKVQIIHRNEYEPLEILSGNPVEDVEDGGKNEEAPNTIYVVNDNMSAKDLLENFSFVSEDRHHSDMEEEDQDVLSRSLLYSGDKDFWNWKETEALIKLRKLNHSRMIMAPVGTKCLIWQEISNELKELGITKSPKSCDDKWRRLKMGYTRVKKQILRGLEPRWQYFNQIDEIFQLEESTKNKDKNNSDHVYHKQDESIEGCSENAEVRLRVDCKEKWTNKNVLLLLKYRRKYDRQLKTARSGVKMKIWNQIAAHVSKSGFAVNGNQCNEKWRNMVNRFNLLKKRHRRHPNSEVKWAYYGPMETTLSEADVQESEKVELEEDCEYPVFAENVDVPVVVKQMKDSEMQTEEVDSSLDVFSTALVTEMLHQKKALLDVMREQTKNFEARLKRLEEAEVKCAEREKEKDKKQEDLIRSLDIANNLEERKIRVLEKYLEKMNKPQTMNTAKALMNLV